MRVLLVVGMLLLRISSLAQSYLVKHYTIHDGLVNDEVFCFAQDTSGVMWIGTDNGLSSFDGQRFSNFHQDDGLTGKSITSLLVDEKGQLWAGGYSKGISIREQKGINVSWRKVNSYRAGVDIVEWQGKFLGVAGNTVNIIDSAKAVSRLGIKDYLPSHLVPFFQTPTRVNIEPSPTGKDIWLGSYMGLISIDPASRSKSLLDENILPRLVSEIVHLPDSSSLLGGPGIVRRYKEGKIVQVYDLGLEDTFRVHRILPVGEKAWIAAEGYGLLCLNLRTGEVIRQKEILGIDAEIIHSLFLDQHQNIWVGTRGNGIFCLQPSLICQYGIEETLCEKSIISLNSLTSGELLILSPSGLVIRNNDGSFGQSFCDPQANNYGVLSNQETPLIMSTSLKKLPQEIKVLRTSAALKLDQDEFIYTDYRDFPSLQLSRDYIQHLYRAKVTEDSHEVIQEIILDLAIKGTQIRNIFIDSSGYFWIGNQEDSLWMISTPGNQLTEKQVQVSTIGYHLSQLKKTIVDSHGTIWVCGSETIWKKETGNTTFEVFREDGPFYDIEMQSNGAVWIAKWDGLISVQDRRAFFYPVAGYKGLGQIDAMHIPPGKDILWLASREGLFSLSLSELKAHKIPSILPILIGLTGNQKLLDSPDGASLKLGEVFQVNVSAASFFLDFLPQFRYRTDKGQWVETNSQLLTLPTSQTGLIKAEIQAALPGGNWGPTLPLEYEVEPGFWLNPLTWLGVAIFIALAAWAIARFQITKIKKRDAKEREIQKEFHRLEQQAFSAMLNPHFIFNTINSIQQELLEEDPMLAHRHLSKFAKLIRKNMDLSTRSTISLKEELERLSLYLEMEKLRLGEKIETVIQTDPQIPLAEVEIPSMILQPYVENAIWHGILLTGKKGTVTVRVGLTPRTQILIEIEDDGVGIEVANTRIKSEDHISMGMSITQSRIASFHDETSVRVEQINDEAGISRGTMVTIVIPLKIQLGLDS